jgi:hypothetical protein
MKCLVPLALLLVPACSSDEPLTGMSVVKFCHQFHRGGKPIDLTLDLGGYPPNRMTAATGTCAPAVHMPCTQLAAGVVQMKLLEGEHELVVSHVPIQGKHEYLLRPVVTALGDLALRREDFAAQTKCQETEPPLLMPEALTALPGDDAETHDLAGRDGGAPRDDPGGG